MGLSSSIVDPNAYLDSRTHSPTVPHAHAYSPTVADPYAYCLTVAHCHAYSFPAGHCHAYCHADTNTNANSGLGRCECGWGCHDLLRLSDFKYRDLA